MGYMFEMTFVEPPETVPSNPRGSIEPRLRIAAVMRYVKFSDF